MMKDILQKHLDAFSAGDWDAYKAMLSSDCLYEELATQQRARGPDEILPMIQRWKRAFPDGKGTLQGVYESGDRVIAELEWTGTHTAALDAPFGTIPPTNMRVRLRAALVVTIKDDKIVENHHYFDMMTLLQQLGFAPSLQAPTPTDKAAPAASPRH